MPNHVTHRVVVTGPKKVLERFVDEYIHEDENRELHLDFNRVIPMPESLEDVQDGSYASIGYDAWYGDASHILTYPWVIEAGVTDQKSLQELLEKQSPEFKRQADLKKRNLETYGFASWYDWAIANWGTKWNSYRFRWVVGPKPVGKGRIEFLFATAWSPPEPVFLALSKEMPTLTIDVASYDEGSMYACKGAFEDGRSNYECVEPDTPQAKAKMRKLERYVYGPEPEEN